MSHLKHINHYLKERFPITRSKHMPEIYTILAHGMMQNLYLKNDTSLTLILASGFEQSNHEAIRIWLVENFDIPTLSKMKCPLKILSNELFNYLQAQSLGHHNFIDTHQTNPKKVTS